MPNVRLNDVDLYYETHGDGPPLMLVAGLASDSQSWQPLVRPLAKHFRVILPDNRGVGRTTPMDAPTSVERIADDCAALAAHLALGPCHVLGHSMGGYVAVDLARRYPAAVAKVILAATGLGDMVRNNALFAHLAACREAGLSLELWFESFFYWLFTPGFFADRDFVTQMICYAVEYPYAQTSLSFRNQVAAIAAFDLAAGAPAVRAPALVIAGREDLVSPPAACAALAKAIPGARYAIVDGAAHAIHLEQRDAFVQRIVDFLSR